jgi:hypothetical protein
MDSPMRTMYEQLKPLFTDTAYFKTVEEHKALEIWVSSCEAAQMRANGPRYLESVFYQPLD